MADRPRIEVAVLEGDYADLCGLGLPLSLSLQLQLLDLKLSGALWSAKASASGFSVSLYWPTAPAPEKAKVKKSRRKRKRGKAKERAISSASNLQGNVTTSSASVLATLESSRSAVTPITAHSSPTRSPNLKSSVTHDSPCVDLAACSDAQYEVKDGVHGVSYSCSSDQSNWTPVVGRRKKRGPIPDFIQCMQACTQHSFKFSTTVAYTRVSACMITGSWQCFNISVNWWPVNRYHLRLNACSLVTRWVITFLTHNLNHTFT